MIRLPAKCKRCGRPLIDSLDIAVHIGGLGEQGFAYSLIYSYDKRCPLGAKAEDIGN